MAEQFIGQVTHYFGKARVAAIEITEGELRIGDTIHVVGTATDFTQEVESMQIEHESVESVKAGDQFGIRVAEPARIKDQVYKVVPE